MGFQTVFSLIVFFGILALISTTFIIDSNKISPGSILNQDNENLSFIVSGEGTSQLAICNFDAGNIPLFSNFLWGLDCIAGFGGLMFGFLLVTSSVPWLGIIFTGIIAMGIYVAVRLLRGGG